MDKTIVQKFIEHSKAFFISEQVQEEIKISSDKILKVLIIEDDEMIIGCLQEFLKIWVLATKISPVFVETLTEVKRILEEEQEFDYTFLDWNIEGGNTKEISEIIAKRYPTISISACNDMKSYHKNNGAIDAIEKLDIPNYLENELEKREEK